MYYYASHGQKALCYIHCSKVLNSNLTFFKGSGDGEFSFPYDVAFDRTWNLYVADFENHRVQVFTAEGNYLRQFGRKSSGEGELSRSTQDPSDFKHEA